MSQPTQTIFRFDKSELDGRIPEKKRAQCVAVLCDLIEAVVSHPNTKAGGSND